MCVCSLSLSEYGGFGSVSGKIEIDIKINHEGEVNRYMCIHVHISCMSVYCVMGGCMSVYCVMGGCMSVYCVMGGCMSSVLCYGCVGV